MSNWRRLVTAAVATEASGIECLAGHGLTFDNVGPVASIPQVRELNIGHFLIGEAIAMGLGRSVAPMRRRIFESIAKDA